MSRPRLRNSELGYGLVTKSLHWLTVLALLIQFAVGYWITNVDEVLQPPRGDDDAGGLALLPVHVGLGLAIIALATIRLVWRVTTPLPPWAETLSALERKVATSVERILYALLFGIPATGLALVLLSGEDWEISGDREYRAPLELLDYDILLGLHVTSHVVFLVALAVHLTLVARNRLLRRML
jgi:cytochrome b561